MMAENTEITMRRLRKILKVVFWIPFFTGNPNTLAENGYSGTSSPIVLLSCVVSIVVVIVGMFSGRKDDVSMKVIWILITTLVTIATINILLIFFLIFKSRSRWISLRTQTDVSSNQVDASSKLQLGFLWTFGLGLLLRTLLTIATNIECINGSFSSEFGKIVTSFVMIVFMLSQIGLITYMRDLKFLRSVWIYYSIGMILVANASIWFKFATLGIVNILDKSTKNTTDLHPRVSNTSFNYCFEHSEIYSFTSTLRPYLFQISLDFLLLATIFILRIWPTSNLSSNMDHVLFENHLQTSKTKRRRTSVVSMAFSVVFNTPFVILALLIRFVYYNNVSILLEIWQVSFTVQKSCMLSLILIAFSNIGERSKESCVWKLCSNDLILLCCFVGKVVIHVFGMVVAVHCFSNINALLLSKSIISMLFYFYHTLYIMISKRSSQTVLKASNASVFVHISLFIFNVTMWMITTFIMDLQGHYALDEGEGCLFMNKQIWVMLEFLIIPFVVFYHFQSAMYFYSILPHFVNA